ncbi:MAG: TrmB family transcriptional regulator [Thaumarchaeota archaeon]|nr:TrmB family transcriptional regulator [Nitrososphaerota archaeon]
MSSLRKLGLTEYEARAYVTVVELGEAEAYEVARRSGVPRTRIYDVLSRLESAGLIQRIRETRPAVYSAISPERTLGPLKNQLVEELSKAINKLNYIYLSGKTASKCEVSLLRGMQAYRASLRLLREAGEDLLVRVVCLPIGVFEELVEELRRIREKGVKIYLTVDVKLLREMISIDRINEVLEEFGGRNFASPVPFNFFVADFEDAMLLYVPSDSPENCYGFLVQGVGDVGKLIKRRFLSEHGLRGSSG